MIPCSEVVTDLDRNPKGGYTSTTCGAPATHRATRLRTIEYLCTEHAGPYKARKTWTVEVLGA